MEKQIGQIAKRALACKLIRKRHLSNLEADLTTAHYINHLHLTGLLNAPEKEFIHDIKGIMAYLDRGTGEIECNFTLNYV